MSVFGYQKVVGPYWLQLVGQKKKILSIWSINCVVCYQHSK